MTRKPAEHPQNITPYGLPTDRVQDWSNPHKYCCESCEVPPGVCPLGKIPRNHKNPCCLVTFNVGCVFRMEYENSHSSSGQQDAGRQAYKIIETVPDKNGIILIGIKEDPDGAFVSREKAIEYIRREHEHDQQVAQAEREKVLTKLNDTIPVILFNNPEWDVSRSFLSALADEIESQRGEGK